MISHLRNRAPEALAGFLALALALPTAAAAAGKLKYVGASCPIKHNDDSNIGKFINLPTPEQYGHVTFNIANKVEGAKPWIHWGVGGWKEQSDALSDDKHDAYLKWLDDHGVEIWLAVRPDGRDPVVLAEKYLRMFGPKYGNIVGFSIDMEFYSNINANAKRIDDAIKAINPKYRLMIKGYLDSHFPTTYRGKNDLFFVHTSSESPIPTIVNIHTTFANKVGKENPPVAVGFQIGYPNDEKIGVHKVTNLNYPGWIALKNPEPFAEWGKMITDKITNPDQELGFCWLTVTSSVNPSWDITKGAVLPNPTALLAGSDARKSRFLTLQRTGAGLRLVMAESGKYPAGLDLQGRTLPANPLLPD
jgi:hypothetical protein